MRIKVTNSQGNGATYGHIQSVHLTEGECYLCQSGRNIETYPDVVNIERMDDDDIYSNSPDPYIAIALSEVKKATARIKHTIIISSVLWVLFGSLLGGLVVYSLVRLV